MSVLCKHRIEAGGVYGLCRVGEAELGTNRFSRCHEKLCARCTAAGEETKNSAAPNTYLASVLVDAASVGMAQPQPFQSKDVLCIFTNRWKNFLKRVQKSPSKDATIKPKYRRPNACEHRAAVPLERKSCNCPMLHVYECGKFKDESGALLQIIPARQCELCPGYEDSEKEN